MNWYLWIVFVMNALAAVIYFVLALANREHDLKLGGRPARLLYPILGLALLFWTTAPLGNIGWIYVAYVAFSTVVYLTLPENTILTIKPLAALVLGIVCAMWAVLIVTVGFGV